MMLSPTTLDRHRDRGMMGGSMDREPGRNVRFSWTVTVTASMVPFELEYPNGTKVCRAAAEIEQQDGSLSRPL